MSDSKQGGFLKRWFGRPVVVYRMVTRWEDVAKLTALLKGYGSAKLDLTAILAARNTENPK